MLNRSNLMRAAWAQYRREAPSARFCRVTFAAILRQRWTAVRLLADRAGLMVRAWARYRATYRVGPFRRWAFREALRLEWAGVRLALLQAAERARREALAAIPQPIRVIIAEPVLSPLAAALDRVKYLPAHMSAARAEAAIRARYATA